MGSEAPADHGHVEMTFFSKRYFSKRSAERGHVQYSAEKSQQQPQYGTANQSVAVLRAKLLAVLPQASSLNSLAGSVCSMPQGRGCSDVTKPASLLSASLIY
jgi:hypothetical protein